MSSEWSAVEFQELFLVPLRNGLTRPKAVRGSGVKMINMGELFANERIGNLRMDRVAVTDKELSVNAVYPGDLLFARQSLVLAGAGKCSLFIEDNEPVVFESHLIRCRLDPAKADGGFYSYYFRSKSGRAKIESIVEQVSAAGIRGSDLAKLEVAHPPLTTQKAIAHILGTLDDKIELNRKTSETLEAMAKVLFKSWFVDFDPVRAKAEGRPTGLPAEISDLFPDTFEDSELGEIPIGWRIDSIYSVASVVYGAPFSSSLFNADGTGIPVARIRDLPGESPGVYTTEVHPKGTLILPGDIVVGMDGEFRAYLWGGEECWMNQRVCKFIPDKNGRTCFLRESIRKPLMDVEVSETATTVIHLGKGDIDGFRVVVPTQEILDIFSAATTPLYEEVVANKQQTRVLANIRDALLPKLISGEIRIPDAEKMLEEVGV
jgi:type I restriction enzyme S subunit